MLDSVQMEAQKLDIEVLAPGFKGHIDIFDSLWTFSMGTETNGAFPLQRGSPV